MHKKTFILSIRIQKNKDIKEQMPNKLIFQGEMILTPCCLVSKNKEFDDDFKSVEKSLIHRTVNNRFQPSNFLRVNFLGTFSTDLKLASNSAFFDTYIENIYKKYFWGHISTFRLSPLEQASDSAKTYSGNIIALLPPAHPPLQCGKIFLLCCSPHHLLEIKRNL